MAQVAVYTDPDSGQQEPPKDAESEHDDEDYFPVGVAPTQVPSFVGFLLTLMGWYGLVVTSHVDRWKWRHVASFLSHLNGANWSAACGLCFYTTTGNSVGSGVAGGLAVFLMLGWCAFSASKLMMSSPAFHRGHPVCYPIRPRPC